MNNTLFIIIAGIATAFFLYIYIKYFKKIRCGNMICITGGIKTGKSTLAVRQAIQIHKSQKRKVWVYNNIIRYITYPFYAIKNKGKLATKKEEPALYSNIPLKYNYTPITKKLLRREERPIYGSVAYICEASLVADSMLYNDKTLNEQLLLFNKLWGHSSKGGYVIYDTQSIADNHYSVKRCLNSYIYIHHMKKGLFFLYMWLKEERYSEDNATINAYTNDVEEGLKLHIVPKSTWKKFDCYCYSILTDNKPTSKEIINKKDVKSLKAEKIVSFKEYKTLNEKKEKEIIKIGEKNEN